MITTKISRIITKISTRRFVGTKTLAHLWLRTGLLMCCLFLAQLGLAETSTPAVVDQKTYDLIERFDPALLTRPQSFLHVKGNKFYDEKNKVFVFRGVSIADPDNLVKANQWNLALFQELKRWGVNTVRLPIHPAAWRARGESEYIKLIDQAVVWANSLDIYLIIDWHSIGFLETGRYQSPNYNTNKNETFLFWHTMAYRYQDIPTTALYELYNEPTTLTEPWGHEQWMKWKSTNEQMIDLVRVFNKKAIPLVAGFNWAYDLTPLKKDPIARDGVAYVSHPYPQKENPQPPTKENFFKAWDAHWGFAAKKYPVVCTELGWVQADGYGAHVPVKNDGSYGPQIEEFLEARGISYIAWVFDPHWAPTMINNWNFEPSEQGAFFKKVFLKHQQNE